MSRFAWILVLGGIAFAALASPPAAAQDTLAQELRESQERLERIRAERRQLQRQMEQLQSQVHDATSALANIERQTAASVAVLRELDFQAAALGASAEETTSRLLVTRDRLRHRNVVLHNRLREIYKRGPLHAVRALLGAESFTDLLNRYKYLQLIASYDRALLGEISQLERQLRAREQDLTRNIGQLQHLRAEKLEEVALLSQLETEQGRTLRRYRQAERRTEDRLTELARDEARLTNMMAELERRRVAGGAPAGEGTLTTRDLGSLPWPVEGELLYRFGPERRASGVVLRWNGIGIAAPPGSPVRAVEAGTVAMAGPFEGYGPTVMISHGGGYYTVYLYLDGLRVREGQSVAAGDVIGAVGIGRGPEGDQMEFQVWGPVDSGRPVPVDPLNWLRRRSG